jgi:trehalose-6-phosphate synthase
MSESINLALTMPRAERRERMQALREHVTKHDVSEWSETFLATLVQ